MMDTFSYQKAIDEDFSTGEAESSVYKFHAFVKELGNVCLRQIRATKAFVGNAFLGVLFGVHIHIALSRVE